MRLNALSLGILLITILMSSCGESDIEKKMDALAPQTVSVGEKFYDNLKNENFGFVYDMFSSGLHADYNKNDIKNMIEQIHNKNGKILEYEMYNTGFKTSIIGGGTKHIIYSDYKVFYSSGFVSKEQLLYEVTLDTKKVEKIDAYRFRKFSEEDFE